MPLFTAVYCRRTRQAIMLLAAISSFAVLSKPATPDSYMTANRSRSSLLPKVRGWVDAQPSYLDRALLRAGIFSTRWAFAYANWTHPPVIRPDDACASESFSPDRVAIATFLTRLSPGYMSILQRWFLTADRVHPEIDKVLILDPDFKKGGRSGALLDQFVRTYRSAGARLVVRQPRGFQSSDLSPYFRKVADQLDNCCGWHELQKVAAWRLTEYDAVLLCDADIVFVRPMPELFRCAARYDFLSTAGAMTALNGGMHLLRPSIDTFRGLLQGLRSVRETRQFCAHKTEGCRLGWWGTGKLLARIYACSRPMDEHCQMPHECRDCGPGVSYGQETNQGYFFYFFYINKRHHWLRTAQINPCAYNLLVSPDMELRCFEDGRNGTQFTSIVGQNLPGVKIIHKFGRCGGKRKHPVCTRARRVVSQFIGKLKCCPTCGQHVPTDYPFTCTEPKWT